MLREQLLASAIIMQAVSDIERFRESGRRLDIVVGTKRHDEIMAAVCFGDKPEERYKIMYRDAYDAACFLVGAPSHEEIRTHWFRAAKLARWLDSMPRKVYNLHPLLFDHVMGREFK